MGALNVTVADCELVVTDVTVGSDGELAGTVEAFCVAEFALVPMVLLERRVTV